VVGHVPAYQKCSENERTAAEKSWQKNFCLGAATKIRPQLHEQFRVTCRRFFFKLIVIQDLKGEVSVLSVFSMS